MDTIGTNRYSLTGFGKVVMAIASLHDLPTQAALRRHLANQGYVFTEGQIRHWLKGRAAVSRDFPSAIVRTLPLIPRQKIWLAYNFMLGQDQNNPVDVDNYPTPHQDMLVPDGQDQAQT